MIAQQTPFPLPALARSLTALPGIGPKTAAKLADRGLRTWGDALFFLPLRYEDRRKPTAMADLRPGALAVVRGSLASSGSWGRRGSMWRMELVQDDSVLYLIWFRYKKGQFDSFKKGDEVFAVGVVEDARGVMQISHPELYKADQVGEDHPSVGRIMPVYSDLGGVARGKVRRFMAELAERVYPDIPDPLFGLLPLELYPMPVGRALALAHQPPKEAADEDLDPLRAAWRRVLAVNELLHYELALALRRGQYQTRQAKPLDPSGEMLADFVARLPFQLTQGQNQAMSAVLADMAGARPMARLLAGDVGSGKTVVAAAAAAAAAAAGVQTALMAPTEVLARQHFNTLGGYLGPLGIELVLVLGGAGPDEKKQAAQAAAGGARVLVGTHALLASGLEFGDLGLVIVDEQQRFGVHQRLGLTLKGSAPHMLVLSATPIPRTLALALGGHMDISGLDQLPGGRPKVSSTMLTYDQRRQAVEAMSQRLEAGEQVYVVCPLVEASDKIEANDAVQTQRRLADYFPDHNVALLHGRMDGDDQQQVLDAFRAGEIDVLVATTVVEVGVDVPNATLMVVLGAERFGLSQLHQLRGRVGRGQRPGHCFVVAGSDPGETGLKRLETLARTNDGLEIAEADLALRGPGQTLGDRQSGLLPLRICSWPADLELLEPIRDVLVAWLAHPGEDRVKPVIEEALRRWSREMGLLRAG